MNEIGMETYGFLYHLKQHYSQTIDEILRFFE